MRKTEEQYLKARDQIINDRINNREAIELVALTEEEFERLTERLKVVNFRPVEKVDYDYIILKGYKVKSLIKQKWVPN